MFSDEELREMVSRGARFLDERVPLWFVDIDVNTLHLDDCYDCVLGQLVRRVDGTAHYGTVVGAGYDGNDEVLAKFGLNTPLSLDEARYLGFALSVSETTRFGQLTETWMREIGCRRERYLTQ